MRILLLPFVMVLTDGNVWITHAQGWLYYYCCRLLRYVVREAHQGP